MKYIVLIAPIGGDFEVRCGFGFNANHRTIAQPLLDRGYKVRSAGFFYFNAAGVCVTHGASDSLRATVHPEDAMLIGAFNRAERQRLAA